MDCPHAECNWKKECQSPEQCFDHDKTRDELGSRGGNYYPSWTDPYYRSTLYRDGPGRDSMG